mmetsp:Transcript_18197/g.39080  ORF Transcript_18197/g.39080 Transcript_18197/m.39080 type:complete len:201 (-) Transcript_18197:143-745(-)
MRAQAALASSRALTPLLGSPEWKSLPVALRCQVREPAVPMHGCESAQSTQMTGPFLIRSSLPVAINSSMPMFSTTPFSSFAMSTAVTVRASTGFSTASCSMSSVMSATWPRQSVVPRPCNSSPSTVSVNGSRFQVSGFAGTQSRWLPTKATLPSPLPAYVMITFPRPSVKEIRSTVSGPFGPEYGLRAASTWSEALSSRG